MVSGKVINERAVETQALHQGAHLSLQDTASIHLGPKGLRDAEVFPQDNHVHLGTDVMRLTVVRSAPRFTHMLFLTDECFNTS